jgi:hypothetical protein
MANTKAVFSKEARDKQLDKSGKCSKELVEILASQQFQRRHSLLKQNADPTKVFDTTGMGSIDTLSHATKDMKRMGASMDCPVCMLSGAENVRLLGFPSSSSSRFAFHNVSRVCCCR